MENTNALRMYFFVATHVMLSLFFLFLGPEITKVTRIIGLDPVVSVSGQILDPSITKITRVEETEPTITKVVIEGEKKITRVIQGDPSITKITRVFESTPSITKVTRVIEGKLPDYLNH